MALSARGQVIKSIARGVFAAIALTLVAMALLALLVVRFALSDSALTMLNQTLKVCAIFFAAWACIRPGGDHGFALGAVTGLTYMALGYAIYCLLDGAVISFVLLAGEFLIATGLGALSGAIVANLPQGKVRRRRGGHGRCP